MSLSLRLFTFARLAAAAIAASLWWAAPASAGGGGADASTLQSSLNAICSEVGMASTCPQLPTATQIFLEISGLLNSPPDDVRNIFAVSPCGNLFFNGPPCPTVAVNAVNAPVKSPSAAASVAISYLTSLAFQPGAMVTQYGDPKAARFFYATVLDGTNGQPQVLDIILDDTLGTNKQFSKGPVVSFSLPLVVLKGGVEYPVAATLLLTANNNGASGNLTGTVSGVFPGGTKLQTYSAAALGINFNYSFGASPNSTTSHALYEVQIPLLVTTSNDAAYFDDPSSCPNSSKGTNPLSGYCNAFSTPDLGFSASVLGASIGVAPYAAPLCPGNMCPSTPSSTTYFGFCATFANASTPAVATFGQIGTDGTTYLSTPVTTQGIQCPP
jgi:hypothetical protein